MSGGGAPRLILFDIDGTLVRTGGAGRRALTLAFQDVAGVGQALQGIAVSGRTDAWIVAEAAARHALRLDGSVRDRLKRAYLDHLRREMLSPAPDKAVLPGVRPLLATLTGRHAAIGLLTGNARPGAQIKLEHFDLWRCFRWGVFGDTAVDRKTLLSEALHSLRAGGGPDLTPGQVVVVGDTPLDVEVAMAGGARSLGVATGSHTVERLLASGATAALPDLGDLERSLDALGLS